MSRLVFLVSVLGMVAALAAPPAWASGVAVGSSALIDTLDYSDTFTISDARPDGVYPFSDPAAAALVESTYGNPQVSWNLNGQPAFGSINSDSTYFNGTWGDFTILPYPGPSGVGSATGITQCGDSMGGAFDFGMPYDLRDVFTVQVDAAIQPGYVCLIAGGTPGVAGNNDLIVFFRTDDNVGPAVTLYNPNLGEYDTGLSTDLLTTDDDYLDWHNFGATFDLTNGLIDIYVDEDFKGQIDLKTASNGDFWSYVTEATNDYIRVGGSPGNGNDNLRRIFWSDNFQVGTPNEETPPAPGDANEDGKVDGSDVTILAGNWQVGVDDGQTANWGMGDFNGDGKVDGSDVTILAGNWQYGVTAEAASVPEPSTALLLASFFALLTVLRYKKK